jgi:hypothetical protein
LLGFPYKNAETPPDNPQLRKQFKETSFNVGKTFRYLGNSRSGGFTPICATGKFARRGHTVNYKRSDAPGYKNPTRQGQCR